MGMIATKLYCGNYYTPGRSVIVTTVLRKVKCLTTYEWPTKILTIEYLCVPFLRAVLPTIVGESV